MSIFDSIKGFAFGGDGTSAPIAPAPNQAFDKLKDQTLGFESQPGLMALMDQVRTGGLSLGDALKQMGPEHKAMAVRYASMDPQLSTKMATEGLMSDPVLGKYFQKGGVQDQAIDRSGVLDKNLETDRGYLGSSYGEIDKARGLLDSDREALLGRDQSYGLTDNDLQAYNQAASQTGRMYANSEQSLAQMLADRGLSAAPSGAAVQAFSGLQGNKNEQLANAQLNIATNRINTAQQLAQARTTADTNRLAQANSTLGNTTGLINSDQSAIANNNQFLSSLGDLGRGSINDQTNRQLAGTEGYYNTLGGLAGMTQGINAFNQNLLNNQWAQEQSSGQPGVYPTMAYNAFGALGSSLGSAAGSAASGGMSGGGAAAGAGGAAGKIPTR